MGTMIEVNDTLQLTTEQGFPSDVLDYRRHCQTPITLDAVKDKLFSFRNKPSARIFQLDPVRVYYVHNIDDKWLFWGHVFIQSLTIEKELTQDGAWGGEWVTSGTYRITDIYEPVYQKSFTLREAPSDPNYFR